MILLQTNATISNTLVIALPYNIAIHPPATTTAHYLHSIRSISAKQAHLPLTFPLTVLALSSFFFLDLTVCAQSTASSNIRQPTLPIFANPSLSDILARLHCRNLESLSLPSIQLHLATTQHFLFGTILIHMHS